MEDEGIGFELVAASLRLDASDIEAFLPALATKLEGALPHQTVVRYHGGLLSRRKRVEAVDVDFGDERFHIQENNGRLEATRQKSVRGIVLKNESMSVDVWIEALSSCMTQAAESSESARLALKQMLESN